MEYKFEISCKRCEVKYDSDEIMYFCPKCKHGGLIHDKAKKEDYKCENTHKAIDWEEDVRSERIRSMSDDKLFAGYSVIPCGVTELTVSNKHQIQQVAMLLNAYETFKCEEVQ